MENKFLRIVGGLGAIALVGFVGYSILTPDKATVNKGVAREEVNLETAENNINTTNNSGKMKTAILETTAGTIEIELSKETPVTSSNFVNLATKGFYDGTIFHRIIKGFMIQGGDPNTKEPESNTNIYGTGGPGYTFNDEKFAGEYTRGTIAMANSGPNTNGSQFFIMHQDYPLPKNYVIFGRVRKGIEVVDKIANAPVTYNSIMQENSKPVTPVVIESITIREE